MPRYKPRRLQRYGKFRESGFTKWEARTFSKLNMSIEYLPSMMRQRKKSFNDFAKQHPKLSFEQLDRLWAKAVKDQYEKNGWWKGKGRLADSAWEYFRSSDKGEDAYKIAHPEYKSPWIERQKTFNKDVSALERGFKARKKSQEIKL